MEEGKTGLSLKKMEERLLYYLIDNKISLISPKIYYNLIEYSAVIDFDGYQDKEQFDELLDDLTAKGYFDIYEFDRVIRCPNCDSIDQKMKYNCPQCGSIKVRRFELIEHMDCGFIGERGDFKQNKKSIICPKCSKLLRSNSRAIEIIGVSHICESCGLKFDKPDISSHCQNCKTIFDHTNSNYNTLFTYNTTSQIQDLLPIREIRETLRTMESVFLEHEYNVELEGKIVGKSNKEHTLSIIAEKDDDIIAVDISPWGKVENYTTLLGKKMDITPKDTIMIDLSEEHLLSTMEEIYDIKLFNGKESGFKDKISEYVLELEPQEEEPRGLIDTLLNRNRNTAENEIKIDMKNDED